MYILKEPLVHFLIIGCGLFIVYDIIVPSNQHNNDARIIVDRNNLLDFMQNKSQVFEQEKFSQLFDELSAKQLQTLIDDYVRDEALYRTAKTLGLDKSDYVIRQRLIQQMEFIIRGFAATENKITDFELQTYFDTNRHKYIVPSKITFTHVYYDNKKHGNDLIISLARQKLRELNEKSIPFHAALKYGDRFLYHRNYVEKETNEIASHFGSQMQEQVFKLEPSDTWNGPYRSPYGIHLVLVTQRTSPYVPALEEVRQEIWQDIVQARSKVKLDKAVETIINDYEVQKSEEFLSLAEASK